MSEIQTVILRFEGQEVELEPEVAEDNQSIIDALATWYPMLASAKFARTTENSRLVITATKSGGTKGNFSRVLDATEDTLHPSIALMLKFDELERQGCLTQDVRIEQHLEIEQALELILRDLQMLSAFTRNMDRAKPVPSRRIPAGF